MKKILLWLMLVIIFSSLTWSLFIPLWQFPDEQAHFGHVTYLTEGGQVPMGRNDDLSEEMVLSEKYLGTFRDEFGNNRFTYHPEYRLEYTNNLIGKYESEINQLSVSTRKNFVAAESAYYPHFFYRLSGIIYQFFYHSNLFIRVFTIRLFWMFSHLLLVYFAYKTGKFLFPQSHYTALFVATLTGLQPMLTFVSAGVTSDNLHNLLFTLVIYLSLKLSKKIQFYDLIFLAVIVGLGLISKPQFIISLAIIIPILIITLTKEKKFSLIGVFFGLILTIGFIFEKEYLLGIWKELIQGQIPFFETKVVLARPDYTLWQHIAYTANHTFREVLPWYWGVFRWLSLTLPRWVNQVMMRLLLAAGIGLMIKLWRRKFEPGFWIIVWSALIYFLALFFWDFQQVRSAGFPFGIQGRYYFPVIVPHMVLLIIGIKTLWSKLLLPLGLWFMGLNWIAFYWVTASYFDASNFKTFIIQASQYKPFFAKDLWLIIILGLYFITSIIFSIQLFKVSCHEK